MDLRKMLYDLCTAPGVGGQTGVTEVARRLLQEYTDDVTVTPLGNVLGRISCGDEAAPTVMLEAHLDQIGMVVTGIEDGFVRVAACGGIDLRTVTAADVVVYGDKAYPGVFGSTPPHLAGEDKKLAPLTDRVIDVGMTQKDAEAHIPLGSRVGFAPRLEDVGHHNVMGTSLDDRAGMAAVLWAVKLCKEGELPVNLAVCFAVQEEVGIRGVGSGTHLLQPDIAVAVDVSFAYTPDANKRECGELRRGPMIGFSPILDNALSHRLVELARAEEIPYQREVMGGRTGTDADEISMIDKGVRTALLSVPQKYMHTPVEVCNLSDIENTGRLMAALVQKGGLAK